MRPRWRRWSIRAAAVRNLARLARAGRRSAATATTRHWTTRAVALPEGQRVAIVRAYMAHHQGMTLVRDRQRAASMARMRARFHAEPMMQATELLLQERRRATCR